MKSAVKAIRKHRILAAAFGISLVLVAGGWIWAAVSLRGIAQPLILHFNNRLGINQVGRVEDLAGVGIFALAVVFLNAALSFALEDRDAFMGKLVAAATLGFSILIFIGFAAIISVN